MYIYIYVCITIIINHYEPVLTIIINHYEPVLTIIINHISHISSIAPNPFGHLLRHGLRAAAVFPSRQAGARLIHR